MSTIKRHLILLEWNELCPPLLARWMADGVLPNFKKFFDDSQIFTTVADAGPPALEPWIQWYSMHVGLPYHEHQVFRLTEGPRAGHTDIWEALRAGGLTTMSCSSMNNRGFQQEGGLFLGDPWCTSERAYPHELQVIQDFVASNVQEYTNPNAGSKGEMLRNFLLTMVKRGLRPSTVVSILKQLVSERVGDRRQSYRRAFVLDWLLNDIMRWYWRRDRPDFASFFLNSTAHMQHAYWRHMEPDTFSIRPEERELAVYGNAIKAAYQNMDRLLGDFFKLEREGATLVLASALSQQPFIDAEAAGGRRYYRPRDVKALLAMLDINPVSNEPVMTHQYVLRFHSQDELESARARLSAPRIGDEPLLRAYDAAGGEGLMFDCAPRGDVDPDARITVNNQDAGFFEHFYAIEQSKSGKHHPDGILWWKDGNHHIHDEKVSVLDVFPTIVGWFGAPMPQAANYSGRDLLAG